MEPARPGVLAASQRAIVDTYTAIALAYCAASAWLFTAITSVPVVAWVHGIGFVVIAVNYAVLRRTQDYDVATHVILAVGTMVVSSLYATGGWGRTGFLWTFAYLPYAFFLASGPIAGLWVAVLVAVDLAILGLDGAGRLDVPYGAVEHGMFYASLGIFLLCMVLFKAEVLRSEAKAQERSLQLAAANDELRRRESELNTAQRVARLGSFLWDPVADKTTWTQPLAELFGMGPRDEPLNLAGFRAMVLEADRPAFESAWMALVRDGTPAEIDCRFTRRDGPLRTLHIRARPESPPPGGRVLGTVQDVTDVRQVEEERRVAAVRLQEIEGLKEVSRLKTQFLNTAAHELATPLTPIRLQLHNLKSGLGQEPQRHAHAVALLERNVDRLGVLVQDLLEGARLQSNQLAIERKPVDVAAIVVEASRNQAPVAQQKGVRLEVAAPEPLWIVGDARRLAQVVDNLLANAVKFTPAGKAVHVRCQHASGGVAVFVQDEGIGITPQNIPRLFQPFSQVHDTSQQTRAGTGLGLYICKGIVEAHGGRIGVESDGLGKGARFWFVLAEGEAPQTAG